MTAAWETSNQGLERGCAIQASLPESRNSSLKYPCNGKKKLLVSSPPRTAEYQAAQKSQFHTHLPNCHAGQPKAFLPTREAHGHTGPVGQARKSKSNYLCLSAEHSKAAIFWKPCFPASCEHHVADLPSPTMLR